MTTERHGDQRDLSDALYELQRTLWAFQGLGAVLYPDHHLDGEHRANVAMLVSILTERFTTLLETAMEAEHGWHSTPAPVSEQPQEEQP